ncbi:putative dolichyl pyrophosphate Man9GlcNAc2 alpha-1,3-glucosyltransferase [Colletotrichum siamense]|uniref:putative dolichyl pyrophosphate Man9GlcNAc2 alpha-1,3-glucosyltransferase n=1 Tax=Colletotrichum siamense TaxID=690259 RepID=UPI001872727E|nr:putative dolichyl pyrophosphate Man9GlcNAc2 alpha-1,3-glucosyltransferase [Colletotrichum siamense]KAF5516300.1 putative dolichyl pyrophosphate Man9GlcNAc2 alpha-1,3-glucosyltransferase [Colletotrichum siamense]
MSSPSPHKPRRRAGKKGNGNGGGSSLSPAVDNQLSKKEALVKVPVFPLASFLWPARGSVSQWEVLPLILMVVGLFRWAAGLWGYSGFQKPPMFGDYEAQRHWMEITTQIPVSQWYFHDLQWWGLDYPPLTAYHSWLCGKVGALIDPSWFELYNSRGSDDPTLKIFMRATVIVSEYLIYIPAAVIFVRRFSRHSGVPTWTAWMALVAILLQPGTILIDHVHFQYNTVMLGFVLASMSSMLAGRYLWSAVFFVAALGFKQMALYYAFSVFSFLLGSCVFPLKPGRFIGIALVTVAAFAILIAPLVLGTLYDARRGIDARPDYDGPPPTLPLFPWLTDILDTNAVYYPVVEQLVQMVHRIFPFARGLFEDKVANFWCALNVVVKLRKYPSELLQRGALLLTTASIIPPNLVLFFRPRKSLLPLAFATTAWGFFLFSFQVHEKSVLLPLMPMTLLLAGKQGLSRDVRAWVGFANILGVWTMFPLLKRVDLSVPYAVLTLLWAFLLGLPPTSLSAYFQEDHSALRKWATFLLHGGFYIVMAAWHVVEATVPPPIDKPDLWVVANVGLGAVGFGICYLWCLGQLVAQSDILTRGSTKSKAKSQ